MVIMATHLADQRSALDCLQSGDVLLVLGSQTEHGYLRNSDRCLVSLFLDRCGVYPQAFSTQSRVQNYERKLFSFSLSRSLAACSCLFYPQTASNGLLVMVCTQTLIEHTRKKNQRPRVLLTFTVALLMSKSQDASDV